MNPLFLLDENVTEKIDSSDCISSERVVGFGTPDNIILERAIERNLVIITQDIRFILYAIKKGVNIVYQDQTGERFYIYGSKTEKMKERGNTRNFTETTTQKRAKLIAQYTSASVSLSGLHSLFCF